MAVRTTIVGRRQLPGEVFDLLHVAFPDDPVDAMREFWPDDSVHALAYDGDRLVAHAGYVVRMLYADDRQIETAYVEYVAAEPKRRGYGRSVMRALEAEVARRGFKLAALGAAVPEFYEKLGWRTWRGPNGYRATDGTKVAMPPEEAPMVLDLGAGVDLDGLLECDWRPGEIW
jgi:aminoglycoside 2'-N-acetyltransferase I